MSNTHFMDCKFQKILLGGWAKGHPGTQGRESSWPTREQGAGGAEAGRSWGPLLGTLVSANRGMSVSASGFGGRRQA